MSLYPLRGRLLTRKRLNIDTVSVLVVEYFEALEMSMLFSGKAIKSQGRSRYSWS